MIGQRGMVPYRQPMGQTGQSVTFRPFPGGGRPSGGGNWRWNTVARRYIFVPYPYPYPYPYYGYPQYSQQAAAPAPAPQPCPTAIRLSPSDVLEIRRGRPVRIVGVNRCGQAVDVTVQALDGSQVSGLDGAGDDRAFVEYEASMGENPPPPPQQEEW